MNRKIEKPKVFISYARGSEEYQEKVLTLATRLVDDSIDVILDRWDLKPGQDIYKFMESSVTDQTVTNVLILLNEQYAIKADAREGGVGAETQIISPEIYKQAKQEKFIPVIFARGPNGEVYMPSYLNGRLYIDLTYADKFEKEYISLARMLMGVEVDRKPELGLAPKWITEPSTIKIETVSKFEELKKIMSDNMRLERFTEFLYEIKRDILEFKSDWTKSDISLEEYIDVYLETKNSRDKFLALLKYSTIVKDSEVTIANNFEDIFNNMRKDGIIREIQNTLIHELFVYTIAWYLKTKNYSAVGKILSKTYFKADAYQTGHDSFSIFYNNNDNLDRAISKRDAKNYLSGTAKLWIENLDINTCNIEEFVFGDLICFNYAAIGKHYYGEFKWFPITYPYGTKSNSLLQSFAIRFQSKEHLDEFRDIFGFEDTHEFQKRLAEVEEQYKNGDFSYMRYERAFDRAQLIFSFIKTENVGKLK